MSQTNYNSTKRRTGTNNSSSRRGSSYDREQAARIASVKRAGGGNKKGYGRRRKPHFDITQILMYGIALLILLICVVLVFNRCSKPKPVGVTGSETEETTAEQTELQKEVTVDGVIITGMTRNEAKDRILEHYEWDMKVTYNDEEIAVTNLIEKKVDEVLDEIYSGEPEENYNIDMTGLTDTIKEEVSAIAAKWDVPAKNGGISSFDASSGKFQFTDGTPGVVINKDKLTSDIESAVKSKEYNKALEATAGEVSPDMTAAQAKEKYATIGTYSTTTTANGDRNENIRLSSEALNGMILQPGETFSFNDATGARTLAKGYKPAGAYVNGELVEEPGGGVCQVSSTLYNAVVFSGLKTTERHAHSYEPSYVPAGEDAMVSFDGPDMKFINNSKYPVALRASFADRKLTIWVYGIRILDEGVKVKMRSEKTGVVDPPAPVFEEDQTLQLDEQVEVKPATPGSRWVTYLLKYQGDEVISEEFFHNSSYRGKAATIKRNTSGVVVTTEGSSEASSDGTVDPSAESPSTDPSQSTEQTPSGPADVTTAATEPSLSPFPTPNTQAPTQNVGPGADNPVISPNPQR